MKPPKPAPAPAGMFTQMAVPVDRHPRPELLQKPAGNGAYDGAIAHLRRTDRPMARLIQQVGPCRLKVEGPVNPFTALVEAIVYQQLNGSAAATILSRVKRLFPRRRFLRPADFLAADPSALRAAGLSRNKLAAILDLATKTEAGAVPTARAIVRMSDEAILERLVSIRGVGRWTVEMLLIFHLGRLDVLPVTDYGVRQGFAAAFDRTDLPSPAELREHGERWKPFRSVAAWYLWRAVALVK